MLLESSSSFWSRKGVAEETFSPVWAFVRTSVNAIRIRLGMTAIGHGRGRSVVARVLRHEVVEQLTPRRWQGGNEEAAPRRRRKLPVGPAVVVLLAVGLGAYALSPAEGEAADTESGFEEDGVLEGVAAPTRGTRRIAAPVAALPAPEPEPEVEAAPEPEAVQAEETVTPRMPTALPEPSRQAGPLGQEPGEGSVDTAEAEPEVAAPAGREFGSANVPDGRVFRLRMSRPLSHFKERRHNGFEVTIPESLSLDRAGPIAAAHPDVERAMVLNRGDHAELSIRFVDGRSPAFRVRARGATLEITIGR